MDASNRIIVSTRKGLFIYERGHTGWQITERAFLGDNVTYTLHDTRDGALYAALHLGHFGDKLHTSVDGGKKWEELACPAYPEMPEGYVEPPNPMSNKPAPWSLQLLWCLAAGADSQPGRLYAGTSPGGLFVSDDHGRSWAINQPLWMHPKRPGWFGGGYDWPGIHSVCVDPRDPSTVRLGVSCGGIWETNDDGRTWTQRAHGMRADYAPADQAYEPDTQDAHLLVQCPAAPECFWVQHHNGIFRSTENGRRWTEITNVEPSGFGFAVAVHPNDPDTAWFAPATKDETRMPVNGQLVINRTTDGGKTFTALTHGLPQVDAYDLVYRHALTIDRTGPSLAFGSTTGNLFISDDAGDHWTQLSSTLPPIHAVSFG